MKSGNVTDADIERMNSCEYMAIQIRIKELEKRNE